MVYSAQTNVLLKRKNPHGHMNQKNLCPPMFFVDKNGWKMLKFVRVLQHNYLGVTESGASESGTLDSMGGPHLDERRGSTQQEQRTRDNQGTRKCRQGAQLTVLIYISVIFFLVLIVFAACRASLLLLLLFWCFFPLCLLQNLKFIFWFMFLPWGKDDIWNCVFLASRKEVLLYGSVI